MGWVGLGQSADGLVVSYKMDPWTTLVCGAESMRQYVVRQSVPAWAHSSKPVAAGLLLWARRTGDVSRLLQQRRANAGSATLPAYVGS